MVPTAGTRARPQGASAAEAGLRGEVDLRRAVRWGLIGGATAVFVSAVGMVEEFAAREVLPVLTVGYLLLALLPFTFGYVAARPPPILEGQAPPRRGLRNLTAGMLAGTTTGALVGLFTSVASTVNLRRVFVNVSPRLVDDVLTFDRGLLAGIGLLVAGGAVLGAAGGAVHLIPERWRRPTMTALLWVVTVGLIRDLVMQLLRGLKLSSLSDLLFAPAGGLSLLGAAIVATTVFVLDAILAPRQGRLRRRVAGMPARERRRWAAVAIAATVAVLAATPLVLGNFMSEILDLVGIYLLMALGLNIVVGYAGLLDLGYVAFFAVGAYATAVLMSPDSPAFSPELTFWAALPFVVLAAAFSGVLVGTPVLRMRGDYLAIVTLGFGEIARILFLSDWFKPVFGGAQGITRIPGVSLGEIELDTPPEFFYPIAALVLFAAYVSWALYNSRIGRAWMAMREDEPVAEALGINIVTVKLSAFVIGASLASFGGALFASKIGAIFPNSFSIVVSIIVLVIIIVGGMGSLPGVAVGALVIQGIPQLLREFEEYQFLLYGTLLIYMMLAKPEGLVPSRRRARELHQEEMLQDAWLLRAQQLERRKQPASSPQRPDAGLV